MSWIQHTLENTRWRPQNQVTALVILGVLLALIFGGVYLSQVAAFAAMNREIEELQAERDRLEFINEQLRADIAGLQTVPRLLARAEELGFVPAAATEIEYLVVEGYNPNRARTVVPISIEDDYADLPVYDETFSGWLQQQFSTLGQQFSEFGR